MLNFKNKILICFTISSLIFSGCARNSTNTKASDDSIDQTSYSFTMGTVFTTRVIGENAQEIISDVEATINDTDQLISWRTEGSLTESFNSNGSENMEQIHQLIEEMLQVCEDSEGAFDITVLPLSCLWNFDKMQDNDYDPSQMSVPEDEDIKKALQCVDYSKLVYNFENYELSTDQGLQIELGAAGKGYALDQAAQVLDAHEIIGGMVSAGSSIYVHGLKEDGSKFNIALRNPRGTEEEYIGVLKLTDCVISTSGDYERCFEVEGKTYHHILDPRTGYPAESGLIQATVIGNNGAIGDALSTACFVLGLEKGMELANAYNVDAIFIDTDKNVWYNNADVLSYISFDGEKDGYTLKEYNQ